jgi:hypothetical protein
MTPMLKMTPIAFDINPTKFYALVALAKSVDKAAFERLEVFSLMMQNICTDIDTNVDGLMKANNAFLSEARRTTKKRNPFADEKEGKDPFEDLRHTIDGENFLRIIFDVCRSIQTGFHHLLATSRNVRPAEFVLARPKEGAPAWGPDGFGSMEDVQRMMFEMELNRSSLDRFIGGLFTAENAKGDIIELARIVVDHLSAYYERLVRRHSIEGVQVHRDPVATDIAMSIYENVDANGEIQDGKKPDEVSAYSIRKAKIVADAVQNGIIGEFIRDPNRLLAFIETNITLLWEQAKMLQKLFADTASEARAIIGPQMKPSRFMRDAEFTEAFTFLKDLDPRNVTFSEKEGLQTPEERFSLQFKNETLKMLTALLADKAEPEDIIQYILARKQELRDYYMDENSFYVCKMGAGNPFSGEAPGALTVTPGTRPIVNLDEILGSGFAEVKGFIGHVEKSSKWHDLFVATSPSRTADKSNVLLIGPMGSGKSEILRAVGGDRKSIGVFAQGSDFLTCWKGEAERNPKRLFEACLKLQRESKKHVHILIDEIDTILNKGEGRDSFGSTNLVTEFQILMDGVVHYPHLSVWGATNHPEKIPMPMMRRFNKVLIVGELSAEDRVKLLQHFVGFMPTADFRPADWMEFSELLQGAVGDTVRKICDHVWREKMSLFVEEHPLEAEKIVDWLNENGMKFAIGDFDSQKRKELHARLGKHVAVRPADLARSIEIHLENAAIHHEIREAVATYDRARKFLAEIKRSKVKAAE